MDMAVYLRFVLSLCLVLGLILGATWLMRKFGPVGMGGTGGGKRGSGKRRLKVLEALQIDPKHRLVLVRRDDREHLLLLGAQALVVEMGIERDEDEALPNDPGMVGTDNAR